MSQPHSADDADAQLGEASSRVWLASHPDLAAILLGLAAPLEGEGEGHAKLRRTVALEVVLRWLGPDSLLEAHRLSIAKEPFTPFFQESALEAADALGNLRHSDRAAFAELMERLSSIPAPPLPPKDG
jgi:hypothetical protein